MEEHQCYTHRHTPIVPSQPMSNLCTAKDRKPSTKEEMDTQDAEDIKTYKPGELLSCDNVGPVNPKSFEGYTQGIHLERHGDQAHVLTLGQRSNRGSVPRRTR